MFLNAWVVLSFCVASRIVVVTGIGIPASVLCITRRLYYISTTKSVVAGNKKRIIITDLAIALGFPILELGLRMSSSLSVSDPINVVFLADWIADDVTDELKYVIYEKIGCFPPTTPNTALYFLLVLVWPSVFGVVSAIYSCERLPTFLRSTDT
jgi:pheromone a factor receptor